MKILLIFYFEVKNDIKKARRAQPAKMKAATVKFNKTGDVDAFVGTVADIMEELEVKTTIGTQKLNELQFVIYMKSAGCKPCVSKKIFALTQLGKMKKYGEPCKNSRGEQAIRVFKPEDDDFTRTRKLKRA